MRSRGGLNVDQPKPPIRRVRIVASCAEANENFAAMVGAKPREAFRCTDETGTAILVDVAALAPHLVAFPDRRLHVALPCLMVDM
jgi:hypothetical protein